MYLMNQEGGKHPNHFPASPRSPVGVWEEMTTILGRIVVVGTWGRAALLWHLQLVGASR